MQEVKISLQIGEITHEIGEKKPLAQPYYPHAQRWLSSDAQPMLSLTIPLLSGG